MNKSSRSLLSDGDEEEIVTAVVRQNNLDQGTKVTEKARKEIKSIAGTNDHSGHIIANRLGGSGKDTINLIPMPPELNNQNYKYLETFVYKVLDEHRTDNWYCEIQVELRYKQGQKRPYKIIY